MITQKEGEELNKQFALIYSWLGRLNASEVAMRRIMFELAPSLSPDQRAILSNYSKYRHEAQEKALLSLESADPGLAAALDNALPIEPPPNDND